MYAAVAAVVLYAQTECVEVAGTPPSPRPGSFVMDLHRPRIMRAVEPTADHTAERSHPAQVALLLIRHAPAKLCLSCRHLVVVKNNTLIRVTNLAMSDPNCLTGRQLAQMATAIVLPR